MSDLSTSIKTSIAGVQEELVTAGILTAIILLLFLHLFRVSLIVLSSTLLTLVVVPVVYTLADGLGIRLVNLRHVRFGPVHLPSLPVPTRWVKRSEP